MLTLPIIITNSVILKIKILCDVTFICPVIADILYWNNALFFPKFIEIFFIPVIL